MSEASELVVVRAFTSPPDAHVARSVLDAVGIPTYLADENIIAADWLYSNAVGGVKLLVPSDRLADAIAMLDAPATEWSDQSTGEGNGEPTTPSPGDVCAQCGGAQFEPTAPGRRWAALTWLVVGVPLWRVRHELRCRQCGATLEVPQ